MKNKLIQETKNRTHIIENNILDYYLLLSRKKKKKKPIQIHIRSTQKLRFIKGVTMQREPNHGESGEPIPISSMRSWKSRRSRESDTGRPRNQLKAFIMGSDENNLVFDTSEERKPYSVSIEKYGPSRSRWYFNLLGWRISSLHLVGPPRRSLG